MSAFYKCDDWSTKRSQEPILVLQGEWMPNDVASKFSQNFLFNGRNEQEHWCDGEALSGEVFPGSFLWLLSPKTLSVTRCCSLTLQKNKQNVSNSAHNLMPRSLFLTNPFLLSLDQVLLLAAFALIVPCFPDCTGKIMLHVTCSCYNSSKKYFGTLISLA